MSVLEKIKSLAPGERIKIAREKMDRIVDHFLYLLELHENNQIIVYSPILAGQIPTSHAANAFLTLQRGFHQFEVVRLCALWDSVDLDKENISTVVELVDDQGVMAMLAAETEAHWLGGTVLFSDGNSTPEVEEAVREGEVQFGREQALKGGLALRTAIGAARAVLTSIQLASVMNVRDKHLAHSLSATRRERRTALQPMKYGDERQLLLETMPIVESLYCWVSGKSFDFSSSRDIDRRNAEALWSSCKFDITY